MASKKKTTGRLVSMKRDEEANASLPKNWSVAKKSSIFKKSKLSLNKKRVLKRAKKMSFGSGLLKRTNILKKGLESAQTTKTKKKKVADEGDAKGSFKELFLNVVYFAIVFVFAVGLSTQALARKVNTYQTIASPIFFYVDKQEVVVPSTVSGHVIEIFATPGQHVNKGDLIVKVDSSEYDRKIKALEAVAEDNFSARTELDVLKSKEDGYNIHAPQSGVIYQMDAAEGSYLSIGGSAFTLFSDTGARLVSYVTPLQYSEIQRNSDVNVYSKRLEQIFHVKLDGIGRVTSDPMALQTNSINSQIRKYELIFQFVNEEDGAVFIEQESLQLIDSVQDNAIKRPMDRVTQLWNALIIGE